MTDTRQGSAEHEQRRHDRVPVNQEFAPIADYISEYVTDLSRGGVFIRTDNPLPVGTTVNLNFSVIVEDVRTIEGEGEVVRVEQSSKEQGMGIAFNRLTASSQQVIDEICELHDAGEWL
jgi:uncharacterized protein (TIGR02266 family)